MNEKEKLIDNTDILLERLAGGANWIWENFEWAVYLIVFFIVFRIIMWMFE